jgi:hypothetical protein
MKTNMHMILNRLFHFVAISLFAASLFICKAAAEPIATSPQSIVSLNGAGAPGTPINLTKVGSPPSSPYIVPSNKSFILTDIIISPQSFPPTDAFLSQVYPSIPNSSFLTVTSMATEPLSFQVHLNTGMVFPAGSKVIFSLVFGSSSVNVSAFGYTFQQ